MIRIFLFPWRLYEESAATITLNGEILIYISLKTDSKKNLTTVTLTVEHCPGVPHQLQKDRKRDLSEGREELKLTVCKNKKRIWKKFDRVYDISWELRRESRQLDGHGNALPRSPYMEHVWPLLLGVLSATSLQLPTLSGIPKAFQGFPPPKISSPAQSIGRKEHK